MLNNTWIWAAIGSVALWIAITLISGGLSTKTLFLNITLASFTFLLGIAEMLIITSGDGAIDLSVPYTLTLSAYIASALFRDGNTFVGVLIIIGLCVFVGLINGLINMYLHVHAMIGTLAVGYILFSVVLEYPQYSTKAPTAAFRSAVQLQAGGFSILTAFCILFAIMIGLMMYKTKFGKRIHAAGQGHHIAYLAGINVKRVIIPLFIASSLIAGLTGILLSAYVGGSYQSMGDSYLMPSIASALVGGTVVSGGKSSVTGVFCGAIMLMLLSSFLTLTGLSAGIQYIIEGGLIILVLLAAKSNKE